LKAPKAWGASELKLEFGDSLELGASQVIFDVLPQAAKKLFSL
jgi:hypothetical protein